MVACPFVLVPRRFVGGDDSKLSHISYLPSIWIFSHKLLFGNQTVSNYKVQSTKRGIILVRIVIYFHETIDFSLTSVTSSHVQIWKIFLIKLRKSESYTFHLWFVSFLGLFLPLSKSLSFRENIWNLTRNVYLMSIFSIATSRYQRHILVWCLIYINTYLI
jgi:hypothetical protein